MTLSKAYLKKKKARFLIKQILKDEIEKKTSIKKTLQNKKK
jgi:hypothetical protein